MSLRDELTSTVTSVFRDRWTVSDTDGVPDPEDLLLGSNDAVRLEEATILYADMDGSTNMVASQRWSFSAEVYKCYLHCAGQLVRHNDGSITAYDGDRIMAVFVGTSKNTNAVTCAFNINDAVINIINPALKKKYPETSFQLKHVVGIDCSEIYAARTGVRKDNDIVWVGRAANYAAKLAALPSTHAIRITSRVYNVMGKSVKHRLDNTAIPWEPVTWNATGETIYRTNYWRKP